MKKCTSRKLKFVLTPISKKLEGHIAFWAVCLSSHPFITLFLRARYLGNYWARALKLGELTRAREVDLLINIQEKNMFQIVMRVMSLFMPRHKKWCGIMLYRWNFECLSVHLGFIISYPLHNSDTIWDIYTPDIWSILGYMVFAFLFVHLYVGLFVRLSVTGSKF